MSSVIRGKAFVVGDNIDTDQIIPAQYLNLVPTIPDEYAKLGRYALSGLPHSRYPIRFVGDDEMKTSYAIVIAGRNFGCGSSREHAPIALGASGCEAVVAESFARIFFRNCVATGELYPVESTTRLCEIVRTGDEVELDLDNNRLTHLPSGRQFTTKPLGDARPVIEAGGIFEYARRTGMIPNRRNHSEATARLAASEPPAD
ncbi:MAG: 3-isopropylmalate dehydratase [Verrucomicrobiae bacterium]|nr:3-isopropylmalate dehydratase [Verrucomicrobiae bacterium]MCX7915497.1 3-isopropylmalate dehydratase [Verrucomicrobiae bacterium]MDW8344146.1 3-isopropylmalate dehydratase [Verrucomicrobiae bacterium]